MKPSNKLTREAEKRVLQMADAGFTVQQIAAIRELVVWLVSGGKR